MSVALSKLVEVVAQVMEQFHADFDVDLDRFFEAYQLEPRFLHTAAHWDATIGDRIREMLAFDKHDRADSREWFFPLIEALVHEYHGDDPLFFRMKRGVHMSPIPRIQRQLEGLGYGIGKDRKIRAIDSESPKEVKDQTELEQMLRNCPELHPDELTNHLLQSGRSMLSGSWTAAAGEARKVFDGLVEYIALADAKHRGASIPGMGSGRNKFNPCKQYLRKVEFMDESEEKFVGGLYSLLSVKGGHHGITNEQEAKLSRRHCWVASNYLLKKYGVWKANGYEWR